MEQKFIVEFKGKLDEDAWKDKLGHIWFNKNEFEYCPPTPYRRNSQVIIQILVIGIVINLFYGAF